MTIFKKILQAFLMWVGFVVLGFILVFIGILAISDSLKIKGQLLDIVLGVGFGSVVVLATYLFFYKVFSQGKKKKENTPATTYQNTCSCGNTLAAAAQFCSVCEKNTRKDEPAKPKICSCGNTPEANMKFCNVCGRLV
jgi:hypothetical protein